MKSKNSNYKKTERLFTIVFLLLFSQQLFCKTSQDSVFKQPIVLMSSQMLDEIDMNVVFIHSFDFTPQKQILLSSLNQFYLLGWKSFVPLASALLTPISSFAYNSEGKLLIVSENSICSLNVRNQFVELYPLPRKNMGIICGKNNVVYAYDKIKQENHVIYKLREKEAPVKIVELSTPIASVLEVNENILFATQNKICLANLKSKTIEILVQLPKENEKIISMTQDYINDVLYFSTNDAVCALKDRQIGCVIEQIGGLIKCYHNELYVFNPRKKSLISFYINNISGKKETKSTNTEKPVNKSPVKKNTTTKK
jgi:soluble P-type ATPase